MSCCAKTGPWRPGYRSTAATPAPAPVVPARVNTPMVIDTVYQTAPAPATTPIGITVPFDPTTRNTAFRIYNTAAGYVMTGIATASATQPIVTGPELNIGAVRVNKVTGALDLTYGIAGKTVTTFIPPFGPTSGTDAHPGGLLLPGDEIYTLGSAQFGSGGNDLYAAVVKLDVNGFLANDFGSNVQGIFDGSGLFSHDLDPRGRNDELFSGVLDRKGNLVTTGFSNPNIATGAGPAFNFGTVRVTPRGVVDPTFGVNGVVLSDIASSPGILPTDDRASAIMMDGDKIIVGGRTKYLNSYTTASPPIPTPATQLPFNFALIRYNPDGSVDETFGNYTGQPYRNLSTEKGKVIHNFGFFGNYLNSQLIQMIPLGAGKFMAYGRTGPGVGSPAVYGDTEFIAARYFTNGMLDTTYGTNGIIRIPYLTNAVLVFEFAAIDPVTQYSYMVGRTRAVATDLDNGIIVRLTPDGALDPTFGTGGIWNFLPVDSGYPFTIFRCVIVDTDGSVVISGDAGVDGNDSNYFSFKLRPA